ncbi:MAG: hypothetical protein AB8C46_02755 [Burkholderiaceae bacterium]
MNKIITVLSVTAVCATVALGISHGTSTQQGPGCETVEQAMRHLDQSRNGISVTCARILTDHARHQGAQQNSEITKRMSGHSIGDAK